MTTNPKWPEITEALIKDQTDEGKRQEVSDRPDIVACVFVQKMQALLKDVRDGLFGKVAGMVYTVEFQKRGLPHMHLLIFLHQEDKIRNPKDVDDIVSAQIPDPVAHPLLYETVTKHMVHGPCGPGHESAVCMVDHVCSKRYPKQLQPDTLFGHSGYPEYARPDNGRTFTDRRGHLHDNKDIVPHNPYLSAKYGGFFVHFSIPIHETDQCLDCHINVEICASVKAIKYIHKYIYKGHDRTTLEVTREGQQAINEIKEYVDARYISAIESCWHIFEFPMHAEKPTVYHLAIHLPDQQLVYYNPDDILDEIVDRESSKETTLTTWFKANRDHEEARQTTYQEFPQTWVYDKKKKKWTPRQHGFAIGRMYFASPSSGERFYLRTLLTVVKGATSFEDLRTVDGVLCPTFKHACKERGLLQDDKEWIECLNEAADMQTGSQLHTLFATILLHCISTSPHELWHKFKDRICDDLAWKISQMYPNDPDPDPQLIHDYGLYLLNQHLMKGGKRLAEIAQMPLSTLRDWGELTPNFILHEQLDYDHDVLAAKVQYGLERFNPEQKAVYNAVMKSYDQNLGKTFFVHSAGGGGKTFVCNTIAAAIHMGQHENRKVALCVASSGIASLLLDGGRTAHLRFKIPIPVHENSPCNITKNSLLSDVLKQMGIIIWDEVPMQHKFAVEALDRTLQDVLGNKKPFGGITVLFGGDFRQTLPVVQRGSRHQILDASLRNSRLWRHVKMFFLKKNMRLDRTPESDLFAKYLLEVGAGKNSNPDGTVTLYPSMCCGDTVDSLIDAIYPSIAQGEKPDVYFKDRTLLSCKNDDIDDLNMDILTKFPGEEKVLRSADSIVTDRGVAIDYQPYPVEYLNSLNASGLPLARLALKPGCPLMLLRNLDPSNGLCNGTRMILLRIKPRVLECRILGGDGKTVFIPRMSIEPSEGDIHIPLSRRQFPVRLAFAMTINKSQGQSVQNVGLDLRTSVFSHGQLYVALSRCTSASRIKVLFPEKEKGTNTPNIVWDKILAGI